MAVRNPLIERRPIGQTRTVELDHEWCYRAVSSRDSRFDGYFVTAVRTTGIYCRPSCPAVTPHPHNVEFFATAAAAHERGYRACKRCRPDASPGSPEWDVRGDAVARAMRLIADGVVDREGVSGLASRLNYSERHVNRIVTDELGAGPLAIARAQRAQAARLLIETTSMAFTDVAFAAGFGSVRQFNDTIRAVFAASPSQLRARRLGRTGQASSPAPPGERRSVVDLAVRTPFDLPTTIGFLAVRAVPGTETFADGVYRRSLALPHGHGVAAVRPELVQRGGRTSVRVELALDDWRDLAPAVRRVRRLLDLDADPVAVDDVLGAHPAMRALVERHPGRRVPGSPDPFETAVRAVVGQQVSILGARTVTGRIVAAAGERISPGLAGHGITHVFPSPEAIAAIDPRLLAMPTRRRATLAELGSRVALGKVVLDVGGDRDDVRRSLLDVPGIGPWTADYVIMRGFGDPDVFLPDDLGVKQAMAHIGLPASVSDEWRPWRSYALHHLWGSLATSRPAPAGGQA